MPTLNPSEGEVREQGPREVHPFKLINGVNESITDFGPTVERATPAAHPAPAPVVASESATPADTEPNEPARPAVVEEDEVPTGEQVLEETAGPEAQEAEAERSETTTSSLSPEIL